MSYYKTTVIIPVYNTKEFLTVCLESVCNQSQKEIEVIVIDDGSTDNSLSILNEWKKTNNIVIISHENKGLGAARNEGIALARGEYIFFLDSDDYLYSLDTLQRCYDIAKKENTDMIFFDAYEIRNGNKRINFGYDRSNLVETGRLYSGFEYAKEYWSKSFCPSACLIYYRKDFLINNNIFFDEGVIYEDNVFYCKSMMQAKRIFYLPEKFYARVIRQDSITQSEYTEKHANDLLHVVKRIYEYTYGTEFELFIYNFLYGCIFRIERESQIVWSSVEKWKELFEYSADILDCTYYSADAMLNRIRTRALVKCIDDNNLNKRWELIEKKLQFTNKNKRIVIYGIGRETLSLLEEYKHNNMEIEAKLYFVETKLSKKEFYGYRVYSFEEMDKLNFDYILIAASRYEKEIEQTICYKYGSVYNIKKLKTDIKF